ncbi:hypothetical protein J6590_026314 [Homalodisca vitripennis]|nr:hypothetical protein J6590_026314 [Homalodisca vitripennis]
MVSRGKVYVAKLRTSEELRWLLEGLHCMITPPQNSRLTLCSRGRTTDPHTFTAPAGRETLESRVQALKLLQAAFFIEFSMTRRNATGRASERAASRSRGAVIVCTFVYCVTRSGMGTCESMNGELGNCGIDTICRYDSYNPEFSALSLLFSLPPTEQSKGIGLPWDFTGWNHDIEQKKKRVGLLPYNPALKSPVNWHGKMCYNRIEINHEYLHRNHGYNVTVIS